MARRTEIDETLLTLEDLAHLLARNNQLPFATIRKLEQVVRTDSRFAKHVDELEALARDAGIDTALDDWPVAAFYCHRDFDRLVEVEDWQHPAEVLDPDGTLGISYRELMRVAEARAARSREPGRWRELRGRLDRAWREGEANRSPVQSIAAQLSDYEPDTAERVLSHAFAEYKRRRSDRPRPGSRPGLQNRG